MCLLPWLLAVSMIPGKPHLRSSSWDTRQNHTGDSAQQQQSNASTTAAIMRCCVCRLHRKWHATTKRANGPSPLDAAAFLRVLQLRRAASDLGRLTPVPPPESPPPSFQVNRGCVLPDGMKAGEIPWRDVKERQDAEEASALASACSSQASCWLLISECRSFCRCSLSARRAKCSS